MVTIRDVGKESGFSSTTVSLVLNNAPLARYIPAATKKRIEKAAKKLGYRPNQFARSLRSKRSHTVGSMVFDMTDPFCTLVLRGIENTLYQSSYLPILTDVHNERSRFERYLEMLLDRRVERELVHLFRGALTGGNDREVAGVELLAERRDCLLHRHRVLRVPLGERRVARSVHADES